MCRSRPHRTELHAALGRELTGEPTGTARGRAAHGNSAGETSLSRRDGGT